MGMKMCCLEGREGEREKKRKREREREREMIRVCATVGREINSPV